MGLFEDFTNFLESRLDEFLQSNPELNLTILEQEVKQQKKDTIKLINSLDSQQKILENKIVSLGKEISIWYSRINKAKTAGRLDLAQAAEQKQDSLLQEGNIVWQKMEDVKQKSAEAKRLLITLEEKEREINLKMEQVKKANQNYSSSHSFDHRYTYSANDDLEAKFQEWEVEQELQKMKKNL
jgi:uncharacterized protein (TIGR04376 family)